MKKNTLIGLALTIIVSSGCATKYDTEKTYLSGGRGFYQEQLKNDVWRIDFTGNTYTDTETRHDYVLKKAAQITLKENYSFFKVIHRKSEQEIKETELGVGNAHVYGRGRSNTQDTNTDTFTTITIQLLKEKSVVDETIYDAHSLVNEK
ncbi:MAG: hypothetical protein GQ582_02385 [Methyloprofundus sp.]|nr:hypothetical protein [Methyloprofundus sp.]